MFKSIDSVIKSFTQAVKDLDELSAKHSNSAANHEVIAAISTAHAVEQKAKAARAAKLSANISSLLK